MVRNLVLPPSVSRFSHLGRCICQWILLVLGTCELNNIYMHMYTHVYLYLWYNWYTPHNWQNRCHLNIPNELFVPCFWLCSYSSNVLPETPIQRGGAYWEDVVVSSKLGCFRFFDIFPDFFQIYFFHDAKKKFGVVTLFHCHSEASFFCKIWMIF